MSLYFDYELERPEQSSTSLVAWHKQLNIFAVAYKLTNGGTFYVYNKDGQVIRSKAELERKAEITAFSWHSDRQLLAVGWSTGELFVWNNQEKVVHKIKSLHDRPITTLSWSGPKFASGDKGGAFAIWKIDGLGRSQSDPISKHHFEIAITSCISKSHGNNSHLSITNLAKAAVSGDQIALDLFADFNSGFNSRMKLPQKDGESFFVGTDDGKVFYVNDKGEKNECVNLECSIKQLLHSKDGKYLVAMSSDLQVVKCRVNDIDRLEEVERVKFSGQGSNAHIAWVGNTLLACATSDHSLRLWDIESGDNFSLPLDENLGFTSTERIVTVDYMTNKGYIGASTNINKLAVWMLQPQMRGKSDRENCWKLLPAINLKVCATTLQWNANSPIIAIASDTSAWIFTEQQANYCISPTMVATQTGQQEVSIEFIGTKSTEDDLGMSGLSLSPEKDKPTIIEAASGGHCKISTHISYSGMDVASEHLAVWNKAAVEIYEILSPSQSKYIGTFNSSSISSALHDNSFFSVDMEKQGQSKVLVKNFQGIVKQLLTMQEADGEPTMLSTSANYMVVATNVGCIRVYDLSRRDAKPHSSSKYLTEHIENFGQITHVSCSPNGSKVAVLCTKDNGVPDTKLYVYDIESNKLQNFDFATGFSDDDDLACDSGPKTDIEQSKCDAAWEVSGRFPVSVHWDVCESRLLSCQAQILEHPRKNNTGQKRKKSDSDSVIEMKKKLTSPVIVVSLFSTPDHGLMLQDSFERRQNVLVGLKIPYFYFNQSSSENEKKKIASGKQTVSRKIMRDFVGLDCTDASAQNAMLNFSYHLTAGDMDEAFKAIKLIKGSRVWESMARMCVKSRRLDVAQVCLANMGHARGVRAVREAEKEPEKNARVARLALELKMNDEAERLYIDCKRYDLLNHFYQATGQWRKALETAETHDRIHLRSTYYNYAKHLETIGDLADAIIHYEKSGTHHFEVPRMLFDELDMLEAYVMKSKDRKFRKWWAQYMESTGDMDSALKFYKQAADPLSLVRVYSYCGQLDKASEVANETGDRAACFHLARQYEQNDDIKQAIHFFTRAMAYGNAIRICKEHGFEDQLMNLALLSSPNDMMEAARHYEERPDTIDKSVMLYHKAGHFSKAVELAFEYEQFGALELISNDLDENTDPILLARCAEFFAENGQHDRAVSLLVAAKKYIEAITICSDNNVRLDEELVEKLTVPKDDPMSPKQRHQLLIHLGDCCMKQGEYHLACKKFTQASDRDKAMKALLKSGDTEKIIFFAGVSRQRNIYVMAANYLQSLDWRKEPEVMKNIISFYTKGKAFDSLASFYDACAQVEIDEYQNYEKAVGALTEAFKCLTKAKMSDKTKQENKITDLKSKIALIKKFITTRRLFETDPNEGVKQCLGLLQESDLNASVRYGDVYAILIEYYAAQENYERAYQYVQELRQRMPKIAMSFFINMRTLQDVHDAVGAPLGGGDSYVGDGLNGDDMQNGSSDIDDDDSEVHEEIYENNESQMVRASFAFR